MGAQEDVEELRRLSRRMRQLQERMNELANDRAFVVQDLRDQGWAWEDIGKAMGVSHQQAVRIGQRIHAPRRRAKRRASG